MYREKLTSGQKSRAMRPALDDERECGADHDGWTCTLTWGHVGPHVHHGDRPAYATWDHNRATDVRKERRT